VLAGQTRVFVLPAQWHASTSAVRLSAFGDDGNVDVTLPLAP
jgi:hypothetical protein